ncbi:uncharacterized protein LOC142559803 [Dermacentor variabilis]|uniref:uncharacterized protein LOC142559803 n=1 Tax=Dermacentor variabilis TaxID=34621 RepID=UPI003F5BEFF2
MIPARSRQPQPDATNWATEAPYASSPSCPAAIWQQRPAYPLVTQPRPLVPTPRTPARYPLRLAPPARHNPVAISPLVSPNKPGTLLDPSAAYPCGSYDAYLEAKMRRQHKKKEDDYESTDTSSLASPEERERKQRPRSYFYKGLKLPSGRLVDVRYRNKYIRKWARKEASGDACLICCILVLMFLLLATLYAYASNQKWFFSAIGMFKPKTTSLMPLRRRFAESTIPFTDTAEAAGESLTVEGSTETVSTTSTEMSVDSSYHTSVNDVAAQDFLLRSRAAKTEESGSFKKASTPQSTSRTRANKIHREHAKDVSTLQEGLATAALHHDNSEKTSTLAAYRNLRTSSPAASSASKTRTSVTSMLAGNSSDPSHNTTSAPRQPNFAY